MQKGLNRFFFLKPTIASGLIDISTFENMKVLLGANMTCYPVYLSLFAVRSMKRCFNVQPSSRTSLSVTRAAWANRSTLFKISCGGGGDGEKCFDSPAHLSIASWERKKILIKTRHNPSFTADLSAKFTQINCAEKLADAQELSAHNKAGKKHNLFTWQV